MSSIFHGRERMVDLESLVAGVILIVVGVVSIYLEKYQLGASDYIALIVGLCVTVVALFITEKYTNPSRLRRIGRFVFLFVFLGVFIPLIQSMPVIGTSLMVGFGLGFLVYSFLPL